MPKRSWGSRDARCWRVGVGSQITRVEFRFPLSEQFQRLLWVAHLVAEIVGDATVSIDVVEMLSQPCRQKPGGDGKVLVVRFGQALAVNLSLRQRWRHLGNAI